jgi:type VI secretion system secreted protein VgrG
MARAVETVIEIDGMKIEQFSSLKLSQGIYAHHFFRLECPVETVDENEHTLFNGSKNLIGAPVRIKVMSVPDHSELLFKGVITQIDAVRHNGHPGIIIVSGYSPTIMLDNGPHCRSWERQSLKSLAGSVLEKFSDDWLKRNIAPAYKETIHYTVQYKETAWQFINRLAGTYGEWLYYDGQQLVLGPPKGRKVNVTYGAALSRFELSVQLKPGSMEVWAYDYVDHEVYKSEVGHSNGYKNELGLYALAKSAELFKPLPKTWHNHFVKSKKQVDDLMNAQAAIQHSDLVRLNGCSDLPGFQPGDTIAIKMSGSGQALEDFRIISIEHTWDGIGNYTNEFVAIPASVKTPPVVLPPEPYCESQSAIVVENNDTAKLGRVRVRFHWMTEKEKSPWLRIAIPHAGEGTGLFMLPEKYAEVMVAFAGGNATRPYVIGEVYNGNAKTGFGNAENDIKAIQTRSGTKIIMNDNKGSILIEDKMKNSVQLDGDGTVTVKANDKMVLACGEAKIILKEDGTITISGKEIKVDASEEIKIVSKDNANIKAGTLVKVESEMIKLN